MTEQQIDVPVRIQRKRTKGWRMPLNTVYVGRGSKWGNPFVVGKNGTAQECVAKYADFMSPYSHQPPNNGLGEFLISEIIAKEIAEELSGKNLACWCKLDSPCHADFLLRAAKEWKFLVEKEA